MKYVLFVQFHGWSCFVRKVLKQSSLSPAQLIPNYLVCVIITSSNLITVFAATDVFPLLLFRFFCYLLLLSEHEYAELLKPFMTTKVRRREFGGKEWSIITSQESIASNFVKLDVQIYPHRKNNTDQRTKNRINEEERNKKGINVIDYWQTYGRLARDYMDGS